MADEAVPHLLLLPLELRQFIYHFVFHSTTQYDEVEVTFDENDALCCDLMPTYRSLTLVSRQMYADCVDYFFGNSRFRFTDKERPCRYILEQFCKKVPTQYIKRILKVAITHFSLATLERSNYATYDLLLKIGTTPEEEVAWDRDYLLTRHYNPASTYLQRLARDACLPMLIYYCPELQRKEILNFFQDAAWSETLAGMKALVRGFPSLVRLDLGLFALEWLLWPNSIQTNGLLMRSLGILNTSPTVDSLQLRIQWNCGIPECPFTGTEKRAFGQHGKGFGQRRKECVILEQEKIVKLCRTTLNVKDVTVDAITVGSG